MNNNQQNKIDFHDPYFDAPAEKNSISSDIVLWVYRVLKYWYLFIIAIAICVGVALLKNKSWVAFYSTQAMVMLESRGNTGIVNAVPLGTILRNDINQQILLRSTGMTERTVKRLPKKMFVDYFRQTRFKRFSLYSTTPVRINIVSAEEEAYQYFYEMSPIDEQKCKISYRISDKRKGEIIAKYNERLVHDYFTIDFEKTQDFKPNFDPFGFNFLTEAHLIGIFDGRITANLKEDNSSALTIGIAGSDPFRDIDYMNALLDEFNDYNLHLKNQQADLTISFLTKQIGLINDSLETARISLDKFQKTTGVYEISSPQIREEIAKADEDKSLLAVAERTLLIVSQKIGEEIMEARPLISPADLGLENPVINTLVGEYNEIIERSKYLGSKNPLYNKTIDELNEARSKILKEVHQEQIRMQERKDQLVSKYKLLDLKTDNLPPQERDLIKFERDYEVNEVYHRFLTQRRYEAQIQKASNTPDNFIWEYPRIVSGPNNSGSIGSTYRYWIIIGLLVPLIFVALKEEVLNYTLSTKEECERLSGLPVIGTVENISNKLKGGVVLVKNYPKSSFAEAFRNIRVRLAYMAQKQDKISVLVTSAEPADGKTFIATNIASVFKLMEKNVVILDLDLRRPSVAKTLKVASQNLGVSNYLIGQVSLEEIIQKHPEYDFDVIPAGTLPPNPSELIKTDKTRELVEHLKNIYDYVIIDCSPVGLVSDAYILARMVDTTLFAARRGKTNKAFFKSVIQQLKHDGIENIALVFNDVKGREGYYGTSRYYGDKTYYLRKNSYYHDDYFEN